jgi:flagellar export protein FliJ
MKTFTFPLERVRQWREKQVTIEEAGLQQLFSERNLLEERRKLLEQEARESAAAVLRAKAFDALELQAIDAFRRYAVAQRAAIAAAVDQCDQRIAEQRAKLLEAQRRFELLEKLKDRKLKAWTAEFAREIEAQAGELFLAKWSNQQPR